MTGTGFSRPTRHVADNPTNQRILNVLVRSVGAIEAVEPPGYLPDFFAFFAWRFSFRLCWAFFLTFAPPLSFEAIVPLASSPRR